MICNPPENIRQVDLRVETVQLGRRGDGIEAGSPLASGVRPTEEVILPAQDWDAHGALGGIVAHLEAAIAEIADQRFPSRERVADCLGQFGLAADLTERGVEEDLQVVQQWRRMLSPHGSAAVRGASADAALDGEQGGDPLQGLKRDRRRGCLMYVVELAAKVAPTSDLDQWRLPGRGAGPVEPVEPGVTVGMQKAAAGAEQRLGMDALAIRGIAIEHGRRDGRTPRPLVADHPLRWHSTRYAGGTLASYAHSRPVAVLPSPGESTGTVVSSACSTSPARMWRTIASASGVSRNTTLPIQSAISARSSSTPSRA